MTSRPPSVTILSWVLIASGAVGLVCHAAGLRNLHPFPWDSLLIELIRVVAIVAGAYTLRGRNWARWLALAWIGFHVGISFYDSWSKVAVHALVFALFASVLFRPAATAYFRRQKTGSA
jgi:hypothetical protein